MVSPSKWASCIYKIFYGWYLAPVTKTYIFKWICSSLDLVKNFNLVTSFLDAWGLTDYELEDAKNPKNHVKQIAFKVLTPILHWFKLNLEFYRIRLIDVHDSSGFVVQFLPENRRHRKHKRRNKDVRTQNIWNKLLSSLAFHISKNDRKHLQSHSLSLKL